MAKHLIKTRREFFKVAASHGHHGARCMRRRADAHQSARRRTDRGFAATAAAATAAPATKAPAPTAAPAATAVPPPRRRLPRPRLPRRPRRPSLWAPSLIGKLEGYEVQLGHAKAGQVG